MKVGLFLCDHVDTVYQRTHGDYPQMFENLFPDYDFAHYDVVNGQFPERLDECDLYMSTGSRYSAYDGLAWISELKKIIQKLHKQNMVFIGFCFGHQVLAEALGGKVEKSQRGWCVGVHKFDIHLKKTWQIPDQEEINLLMMCQDQVSMLPPNAELIAGNQDCPIGMFSIGNNILGIQAHPEFSPAYDQILMENRIERIGQDKVNDGIDSLSRTIDKKIISSWINNFINLSNE